MNRNSNKAKITTAIIALLWFVATYLLYVQIPYAPQLTTTGTALLTSILFAITAVTGFSKFSALAGKVLIAIGILSLLSLLVSNGLNIANVDTAIRTFVLLSGIVLERLSPHQQLYNWMFLMIATKVQFILTTVFIATANHARLSIIPLAYWWSLPALMLFAVIFLAMKKQRSYKFIVVGTSILALVFTFDFITTQAEFRLASLLTACLVLWPLITERLIGYKTFVARG
jgi:hypothetical protein